MTTLLIDLDLEAPPREPVALSGHQGVRAVVWRGTEPLGQIAFAAAGDVSPERLLTEARRQLGDTPRPALPAVDVAQLPMVTVAICTRDRPGDLEGCLSALRAQADSPPHEIVVVDNAPSNELTRELVGRFPAVRYLVEEMPGLGFARNCALREARGEILAFADDDSLPTSGWLLSVATVFALNPDVGVCGGPIVPAELETEAQELFELRCGFPQEFDRRVYGD
ncbi:MAG: glycosyltransferase family A protein, partial [Gaiellaceae bacterium]